jgi:hypothetical protein
VGLNCDLDIRAAPRVQKVGQQKPDRIVDAITPLSVPFAPAASSIMTCRYWQDNSMDDILEANTKVSCGGRVNYRRIAISMCDWLMSGMHRQTICRASYLKEHKGRSVP